MKTVYYTAASLDGYIADPEHTLDWLLQFGDDGGEGYPQFIAGVGALAMGSTTYEWVVRHLEAGGGEWPYKQPAWVFTSRTPRAFPGADLRFVAGDVRPVHEEMVAAAAEKDVWLVGGGELVGKFHDQGLLDGMIVTVASVTLGGGAPLLPRRISSPPLRLVSAERQGDAFVQLRYDVPHAGR